MQNRSLTIYGAEPDSKAHEAVGCALWRVTPHSSANDDSDAFSVMEDELADYVSEPDARESARTPVTSDVERAPVATA